ncbi:MAG: phage tail sheath C-terminal domain-containing protein, partial [Bacteroidota bacterium]
SVVQNEEITTRNFADPKQVENVLLLEAEMIENPKRKEESIIEIKKLTDKDHSVESLTQTLKVICPTFKILLDRVRTHMNILPPSAGLAGIFTAVDNSIGVWKAPANVGFNNVITPTIKLTNDDQEDLNITVTGKSVNGIRTFVGEGTVIWGARTLDGNSQDWRYINVRRTMLFIQQSVKAAAKTYVFSPNTNGTWILVKSMISSFLNNIWQQGGLVGASPAEAFDVQVGLGTTMTPNDILDGVMKIMVKVAISRPAEFIVITFQQKMQES